MWRFTRNNGITDRLLIVTDPLADATQFQYDPNGNLATITDRLPQQNGNHHPASLWIPQVRKLPFAGQRVNVLCG
jgi:YD repeat-containing protein